MKPQNTRKILARYLRKDTLGEPLRTLKYYFYCTAFALPAFLSDSPHPAISFFMALPYLVAFAIELYRRLKTTAFLALADEAGELEGLLEDFSNAQHVLGDRLRIGEDWLFGMGMRFPARIRGISELRHVPGESFVQGRLLVTLHQDDDKRTLCHYPANTPYENDIGSLVNYLLKINPDISLDSSMLDLSTHWTDAALARKIASNTVHGRWGTCSWEIDGDGVLTVSKGTGAPCNGESPWSKRAVQITAAHFKPKVVLPQDCSGLFAGCVSLAQLDDNSWDMSKVKSMKRMFCGCSSLKELTGSSTWDTSHVEDMSFAFDGCSSLERIFTANWDTSSVCNMAGLFCDCSSLRYLGIGRWNTSRVKEMGGMFMGCTSLVHVSASQWDTSQVRNASYMFEDCRSLEELKLPDKLAEKQAELDELPDACIKPGIEDAR